MIQACAPARLRALLMCLRCAFAISAAARPEKADVISDISSRPPFAFLIALAGNGRKVCKMLSFEAGGRTGNSVSKVVLSEKGSSILIVLPGAILRLAC